MKNATRVFLTLASILCDGLYDRKDNDSEPSEYVAVCLVCGKTTKPKGCSLAAHLIASGWKNGCCPDCQKV